MVGSEDKNSRSSQGRIIVRLPHLCAFKRPLLIASYSVVLPRPETTSVSATDRPSRSRFDRPSLSVMCSLQVRVRPYGLWRACARLALMSRFLIGHFLLAVCEPTRRDRWHSPRLSASEFHDGMRPGSLFAVRKPEAETGKGDPRRRKGHRGGRWLASGAVLGSPLAPPDHTSQDPPERNSGSSLEAARL